MKLVDQLDTWQQRHRGPAFVVGVVKKYGDDRGSQLAALITYYGFLAMFPLLLVFVTVFGYVAHDDPGLRRDLLNTALADFPVVGQELRRNVGALGGNGIALAVGLLALVWGSLGVAQVAQHAMAQVWNVPGARRPGFGPRLVRSLLVLAVLGLAIVGTAALTTIATLVPGGSAVPILSTALVVVLNVGLYWLAFRVLTPAEIASRDLFPARCSAVWPGPRCRHWAAGSSRASCGTPASSTGPSASCWVSSSSSTSPRRSPCTRRR